MKKFLLITNCITISTLLYLAVPGCSSGTKNKKDRLFQNYLGKINDFKFVYFKSEKDLMTFIESNYDNKKLQINTASVKPTDLKQVCDNLIKNKISVMQLSIVATPNGPDIGITVPGSICFPNAYSRVGGCCPPVCHDINFGILTYSKPPSLKF